MTNEEYEAWQDGLAAMYAAYEEADHAEYMAYLAELDAWDLSVWADTVLARPAATGPELELRHVLDEAAHPELAEAFRRLAPA
jgi:hypothetical protein